MWNQLNRLRFPKITFKWGSPPLPFEFSLNGHCCQLVPLAHELHAWHNPVALISSSCGNFQKHVLVSHNESFSDCHGWIVWGNDNFDANLLIIHRCNRRLRILGKTGPFYEQNWLYICVQSVVTGDGLTHHLTPVGSISSQEWNFQPQIGTSPALNDPVTCVFRPGAVTINAIYS